GKNRHGNPPAFGLGLALACQEIACGLETPTKLLKGGLRSARQDQVPHEHQRVDRPGVGKGNHIPPTAVGEAATMDLVPVVDRVISKPETVEPSTLRLQV